MTDYLHEDRRDRTKQGRELGRAMQYIAILCESSMITCVIGRYEQKNIAIDVSTAKFENVNKKEGNSNGYGAIASPYRRGIA